MFDGLKPWLNFDLYKHEKEAQDTKKVDSKTSFITELLKHTKDPNLVRKIQKDIE